MSLQGKNVIITGATSGFGAQIASVLSGEGATVFIGGRRVDRGAQVAEETQATFHAVDVADEESSMNFFTAAEKHFGGQNVDFIILNAGLGGTAAETVVPNLNVKSFDLCFSVNVRGIFLGLKDGTRLLRTGGTFIFTSSVSSLLSFGGNPVYAASKAAVDSLVRSYAAQFAASQDERISSLSVLGINPALYATEMSCRFMKNDEHAFAANAKRFNPSQRVGKAEELAIIVRDFVKNGILPYKSGDTIACDADTHFPLDEYFSRLKAAQEAAKVES